eukprot:GEMP01045382.1.p1 GENE.GEMP01045382.1~~GEMP01045382.1.p1  ORF type:complete len:167 (+),score=17.40 GEMP01045382.1:110-610(+)
MHKCINVFSNMSVMSVVLAAFLLASTEMSCPGMAPQVCGARTKSEQAIEDFQTKLADDMKNGINTVADALTGDLKAAGLPNVTHSVVSAAVFIVELTIDILSFGTQSLPLVVVALVKSRFCYGSRVSRVQQLGVDVVDLFNTALAKVLKNALKLSKKLQDEFVATA